MNIKKILCYGDSNTWGYVPGTGDKFAKNILWTTVLAELINPEYKVLNEGVSGRFAGDLDNENIELNGLSSFDFTLKKHYLVDILIISLGTNDLNTSVNQTGEEIYSSLMLYVPFARKYNENIKIIFITPPEITEIDSYFTNTKFKNSKLTKLLKENQLVFDYSLVDISKHKIDSQDGVHYQEKDHTYIANLVADKIKEYR